MPNTLHIDLISSHRAQNVITTTSLRQNEVVTSFEPNDHFIITT